MLLVASETTEQMSWQQQCDNINYVSNELGIASNSVMHALWKRGLSRPNFTGFLRAR
jgi:hypothetical protein